MFFYIVNNNKNKITYNNNTLPKSQLLSHCVLWVYIKYDLELFFIFFYRSGIDNHKSIF